MNDARRISVVIPVFNGADFLATAIRSALAQDLPPSEVIVVDDGSRDCSAEVAQSFPSVCLIRKANGGAASARNAGILASRGELIAFLDADDEWVPEKLRVHAERHHQRPETGLTISRYRWLVPPEVPHPSWLKQEDLVNPPVGYIPSCLVVDRRTFERVGLFDPALHVGEGADWFLRVADAEIPSELVDRALVVRRLHANNLSHHVRALNRNLLRSLKASIDRKRARLEPGRPGGLET